MIKYLISFQLKKDNYLDSIQALRCIAFLLIFTYHCGITPGGPFGVSIFFILSGFCVFYGYGNRAQTPSLRNCTKFLLRRMKNLYPLHIILLLFVLLREFHEYANSFSWVRVFADSFLLTSWIPSSFGIIPYNGVAWFLSSITLSYFLFLFFCRFIIKIKTIQRAIVIIVMIYLSEIFCAYIFSLLFEIEVVSWLFYQFPIFRLLDFLIGCILCRIFQLTKIEKYQLIADFLEIFTTLLAIGSLLIYGLKLGVLGNEVFRKALLFTPVSSLVVFVFAHEKGILTKLATNIVTIGVAKISAPAFLIHQVVIYSVKNLIDGGGVWRSTKERIVVFLISFVITYFGVVHCK